MVLTIPVVLVVTFGWAQLLKSAYDAEPAAQEMVKLVRGIWNLLFVREAVSFPKGANDDQIDTASGGNQMIADNVSGSGKTASAEAVVVTAESLFGEM